jgi:hypothetical protein
MSQNPQFYPPLSGLILTDVGGVKHHGPDELTLFNTKTKRQINVIFI